MSILMFLVIIIAYIVVIGTLNEKIFHMQSDIALIFFSFVFSVILLFIKKMTSMELLSEFAKSIQDFEFAAYLMDGVLCFMLFAGASKVNMTKFKQNLKPICLLALLATVISSFLYGALFYVAALILGIHGDMWVCILLGCVVSPTDPIAATGILSKIGLSKNVCSVIENESLFNDGTGVTLFVFVRSFVIKSENTNVLILITKEIAGAVVIALVISFALFKLMKITKDPIRYILISLLDVSLVYIICEHLGCSGVIASVVCGMYFSYEMHKMDRRVAVIDPENYYRDFWEILESILNAILFVMIGMLVFCMTPCKNFLAVVLLSILALVVSRAVGVFISSILARRKIPGNYNLTEFTVLMTWSALKGGLSLALALGTKEYLSPDIYHVFINVAYAAIFFTVLIQGLTVKKAYFALEKHKAERIHVQS